jgi:hypothetical protein
MKQIALFVLASSFVMPTAFAQAAVKETSGNTTVPPATEEATPKTAENATPAPGKKNEGGMFGLLAGVNFESLTTDETNAVALLGVGVNAKATAVPVRFGSVGLLAGAGIGWTYAANVIEEEPLAGLTQTTSTNLTAFGASVEAGAQVAATASLDAQIVAGYSLGLSGKMKVKYESEPANAKADREIEQTLKSLSHLYLGARTLLKVTPVLGVGCELTYKMAGTIKDDAELNRKYSGYSAGLVTSYGF